MARNLIFNTVLDTGDHGNFNSWDRKVWLWLEDPYDPKSTVNIVPKTHHLHNNFIIRTSYKGPSNNLYCIDHDDGSSSYNDTDNFLVYGGIKFREGIEKHASGNWIMYANGPDVREVPCYLGFLLTSAVSALGGGMVGRACIANTTVPLSSSSRGGCHSDSIANYLRCHPDEVASMPFHSNSVAGISISISVLP
jgi:hypothetical protein